MSLGRKQKMFEKLPLKRKTDNEATTSRASIRDRLLVKEAQEMSQLLPSCCSVNYTNENDLSRFILAVKPTEGYWEGGIFKFEVCVTDEYNMVPPVVKCVTKLWHPNITESGEVCLSLLRRHSVDGMGWSPIRRLNDVVWGLNALFTDLLNFEDPLNVEAAEMYRHSKESGYSNIILTVNKAFQPPVVKCVTKLWHPNITESGEVCLSLLRRHSVDGMGWSPIRRLNDVVWGLNALFTDLLNFEDPLNVEAAEMYRHSKEEFKIKVMEYVANYAKD